MSESAQALKENRKRLDRKFDGEVQAAIDALCVVQSYRGYEDRGHQEYADKDVGEQIDHWLKVALDHVHSAYGDEQNS